MKKLYTIMLLLAASAIQAQVCTFAGGECCGEGITNFQLNGSPAINRTSTVTENGGFTNTGITTTVIKNQMYNFSVTFPIENNIVNCNTYNFKIYIDYNHNNLLTDVGEEAATLDNVPNGTYTGSFAIPAGAQTGNTYMRVMMKMANVSLTGGFCGHPPITPCNIPPDPIGFHGEVENYTLNIISSTGIDELPEGINQFIIYPESKSSGLIALYYLTQPGDVSLEIFDLIGKKADVIVLNERQSGQHKVLINKNLNSSGIYLAILTINKNKIVRKFAVVN